MNSLERQIIERFAEFGRGLVGEEWGWQKRFADRLVISPSQLNSVLNGRTGLGAGTREKLAALGCDIEWLMTGVRAVTSSPQHEVALFKIPVYRLRGGEGKGYMMRDQPASYILTDRQDDPTLFGVLMPDTSMTPDVNEGDVIVVSKQRKPVSGDLVLLTLKDERLLIRRYSLQDQGVVLTASDSRQHPPLMLRRSEVKSVWTVVQRIQNF